MNTPLRRIALSVLLIGSAVFILPAYGNTVVPVSLRELVKIAGNIFAGTVDEIHTERTSDGFIVNRVIFSKISTIKGDRRATKVTVSLAGGTQGGLELSIPGQPEFVAGGRYVLLCTKQLGDRSDWYVPIVGLYQGFFSVHRQERGPTPVVHDWVDRPVASIDDGTISVVDPLHQPPTNRQLLHPSHLIDPAASPAPDSVGRPRWDPDGMKSRQQLHGLDATPREVGADSGWGTHDSVNDRSERIPPPLATSGANDALIVIPNHLDPGTRLSEAEFLEELRRLAGE